jgi:hypothetical protein
MILKPASFLKSTGAIANIVVLSFATFLGAAHSSASEQKAGDGDVPEVGSSPLSKISATIAEQYPSVRALALAQGNCVVFEYYRKDIDAETPSPVHSVTKSVLSILVALPLTRVFCASMKNCPKSFPKNLTKKLIRSRATITVRDLLTKTEGFEEGDAPFKIGAEVKVGAGVSGKSEIWRWYAQSQGQVSVRCSLPLRFNRVSSSFDRAVHRDQAERRGLCEAKNFSAHCRLTTTHWHSDEEGYLYGENSVPI